MGTIQVCVWISIINDCAYTRLLVCKLLRILRWMEKLFLLVEDAGMNDLYWLVKVETWCCMRCEIGHVRMEMKIETEWFGQRWCCLSDL